MVEGLCVLEGLRKMHEKLKLHFVFTLDSPNYRVVAFLCLLTRAMGQHLGVALRHTNKYSLTNNVLYTHIPLLDVCT